MSMIASLQFISKHQQELPLTVVLEEGHKNFGDAQRIFHDLKDSFPSGVLGNMTGASKDCLPLTAADFLVYTIFRSKNTGIQIPETKTSSTTIIEGVPSVTSKPTRIQDFILTPKTITELATLHFGPTKHNASE